MVRNSATCDRLYAVRKQLSTKKTLGRSPRDLMPDEIQKLEAEKIELVAEMEKQKQVRLKARPTICQSLKRHATAEADRGVSEMKTIVVAQTEKSEAYFASVGGAGSSTDLRAQAKTLSQRAADMDKADRAEVHEAKKKVEKEAALEKKNKELAVKLEKKELAKRENGQKKQKEQKQAGRSREIGGEALTHTDDEGATSTEEEALL